MSAIRISLFGGIVPRLAKRGLPDNAAQFALNAKLFSGELRAWNGLRELATLAISNAQSVYHYTYSGADRYLAFSEPTQVVKAPLVNETLGRLYWTGSLGPYINTAARIEAASPAFRLGVPRPSGAFTVTPAGGTAANATSRVYVAIFVSTFGEEGGTTGPVLVNGNSDGTWTVAGLNGLSVPAGYGNIGKVRLYRTLVTSTGVDYRQVAEWNYGAAPASYSDTVADTTLSSAAVLQSLAWDPPPTDLKGLISVAGGFLAGFSGRTVYLSMPYYPHAWPNDYQFAVDDDIVGLGTSGNMVVICTEGRAQVLIGQTPDVMALQKLEGVQPCLSARGIVSTSGGVLYPSTDGLVVVNGGSNRAEIVSKNWVTKDEWMSRYTPASIMASVYQDRYFAFYTSQLGFTLGFDDPVTGFTELQYNGVTSVDLDPLTGQTLITIGNKVYEWDGDTTSSLTYTWKSKPIQVPKPVNYAALQLRGTFLGSNTAIPVPAAIPGTPATLNSRMLGGPIGGANFGGSINGPAAWQVLGAPPAPPSSGPTVLVKVYADGVLRWAGSIGSEGPVRLPSGYKATLWELELSGSSQIYSAAIASTAKELENIP